MFKIKDGILRDFWIPKTKKELILWITNKNFLLGFKGYGNLEKLTKKQLYAIYFKERKKDANPGKIG